MEQFRGTKGEWRWEKTRSQLSVSDLKGNMIAFIGAKPNFPNEYNAKLIAQAPVLLSCLEDAVTGLEWEIETHPEKDHKANYEKLEEWKEAIEKALK